MNAYEYFYPDIWLMLKGALVVGGIIALAVVIKFVSVQIRISREFARYGKLPGDERWLQQPKTQAGSNDSLDPETEMDVLAQARNRAQYHMSCFYIWCLEHPNERVNRDEGRQHILRALGSLNRLYDHSKDPKDLDLLMKYSELLDTERLASTIERPTRF